MVYRHHKLGQALGWKHNHTPGICTKGGELTTWPDTLGPVPDDAAQAQAVAEYEAYIDSTAFKDDELQRFLSSAGGKAAKALALVLIDKGVCTMAELKAKYRIQPE